MALGVLLTINLKGNLSGFKKHVDNQIVTVDVSEVGANIQISFPEKNQTL